MGPGPGYAGGPHDGAPLSGDADGNPKRYDAMAWERQQAGVGSQYGYDEHEVRVLAWFVGEGEGRIADPRA